MPWWSKLLKPFYPGGHGGGCHSLSGGDQQDTNRRKKIAIVGSPNVGKSVIFNNLTGAYVTVSNYPGTTVDVSRGRARIEGEEFSVVDTPGMYSLLPLTEEERIARTILFREKPDVVLHVVDARNLERMLPLTFQLIEAGFPVILDLNMMDETEAAGIEIDLSSIERKLGIPVVATAGTRHRGIRELRRKIWEYVRGRDGEIQV
jgi:ferrous iron transport protein B